MGLCEDVAALGANTAEALARLCDDRELYEELLGEILEDFKTYEVKPALEAGDVATATINAHSLKGVTGNLGLTPLYEQYTKMNDMLKAGQVDEAEALLEVTLVTQAKFVEAISQYV